MVEHAAVNRGVAGSSPARGAQSAAEISAAFFIPFCLQDGIIAGDRPKGHGSAAGHSYIYSYVNNTAPWSRG